MGNTPYNNYGCEAIINSNLIEEFNQGKVRVFQKILACQQRGATKTT